MLPWERKYLLKQLSLRYFPHEIISRPKHGFSVPINEWIRGKWAPLVKEIILGRQARERGLFDLNYVEECLKNHQSGKEQHGYRLWLLVCLELWFQVVLDQTLDYKAPIFSLS
jgi:asparagine synthase (glutamine-hydrolysing)